MQFSALFVQLLLWLTIAASPTAVGAIVGFILSLQSGPISMFSIGICALVGFVIGGLWAERIRRTTGLTNFLGRLLGARDKPDDNP